MSFEPQQKEKTNNAKQTKKIYIKNEINKG
jgi:hypothetical protein